MIAPVAGILFFVFGLAATLLSLIDAPDWEARGREILTFWDEEAGRVWASVVLYSLAGFAFLFFLGGFRALLRGAERGVGWLSNIALVGGVAGLAVLGASNGPPAAGVFRADDQELTADSAQTLWDLGGFLYAAAMPFFAAFAVASSAIIVVNGVLPRWLGWVGVVIGISLLVPYVAFATFGLLVIWVAAVSGILLARGGIR